MTGLLRGHGQQSLATTAEGSWSAVPCYCGRGQGQQSPVTAAEGPGSAVPCHYGRGARISSHLPLAGRPQPRQASLERQSISRYERLIRLEAGVCKDPLGKCRTQRTNLYLVVWWWWMERAPGPVVAGGCTSLPPQQVSWCATLDRFTWPASSSLSSFSFTTNMCVFKVVLQYHCACWKLFYIFRLGEEDYGVRALPMVTMCNEAQWNCFFRISQRPFLHRFLPWCWRAGASVEFSVIPATHLLSWSLSELHWLPE